MYYVEFLRVARALRIFGIILLAVIALAGIIRLNAGTKWSNIWVNDGFTTSAKKTVTILSDGTELTIVDDHVNGRSIVVQRRSPGLLDVVTYTARRGAKIDLSTTVPTSHAPGSRIHIGATEADIHGINVSHKTLPNGVVVTHYINDRHVPIDFFLVVAGFVAAIFASIIGGSLSKENDGHLEIAWTKPTSRENYAFTLFAIDAGGIVAAGALSVLAGLICAGIYFGVPLPTASSETAGNLATAVLFPLAWYAMGQALSASVRRAGLIIGMMWVVSFVSMPMLAINNDILRFVLRALNTINPMSYYSTQNGHPSTFNGASINLLPATQFFDIFGLSAILIIAIVASLVQWRRLEA